jgi:hypothetical protein
VKLRLALIAAACLFVAVGAFVWLHTGAPGDAACERSTFVESDGLSAWPPGARCSYGEPARTDVVVNGWFAAVAGGLAVALAVALPPAKRSDQGGIIRRRAG